MTDLMKEKLDRIDKIDAMFDQATGWGFWMVTAANEREDLVNKLNSDFGLNIKHKNLARTASGRHIS